MILGREVLMWTHGQTFGWTERSDECLAIAIIRLWLRNVCIYLVNLEWIHGGLLILIASLLYIHMIVLLRIFSSSLGVTVLIGNEWVKLTDILS